ncbi:acidic mammalian chitinase-like [Centruroides sculpturatus]|uniref:acidic mammalian chitinase-like n=1 Tax=Centruroides sculpturatus TaxID=218467 RepID=UPI000C6E70A4|nr:acidic mammalian chitinase-like [Centruroides sculpturatus]
MMPNYATATMALLLLVGGFYRHERQKKEYQSLEKEEMMKRESEKATSQKLVCYYKLEGNYSYRLQPEDIDPNLCTHLIAGFADTRYDLIVPRSADHIDGYKRCLDLKNRNQDLKVLLSIGATSGGRFSKMINYQTGRERFIHSVIYFIEKYPFDGLDFDWEFPAWEGGPITDKINFITLLKDLRQVFEKMKKPFLLTVAVAAREPIISSSYDIPALAEVVDFVNLLSYDFHYYHPGLSYTHHHNALYRRPSSTGHHFTLNVDMVARYWSLSGMPRKKIMIGISTHAQTFNLASTYAHGIDAPAKGPGLGFGRLPYSKVCYFLQSGAHRIFDIFARVPYAYKGHQWMSFDDEESVAEKAKWVKRNSFGGIMTYNLNNDDWQMKCDNQTSFPLHRTIADIFK